jgi:hypothetical protein
VTDIVRELGQDEGYDAAVKTLESWAEGFFNVRTRRYLIAAARDLRQNKHIIMDNLRSKSQN